MMDNQQQLFQHLQKAASQGHVPESMESARKSLLEKLQNIERERASRHVNNDTIHKMPGMGLLSISHEVLDEPIELFATDLRANHVVRISIFEAHVNKATGKVERDECLAEFILSEKQFGDLVVYTDHGEGYPATLLTYNGEQMPEYERSQDPTKNHMAHLLNKVVMKDDQVSRFLSEALSAIEEGAAKGRLSKKDAQRVDQLLSMVDGHTVSNAAYSVERVNEALSDRVEEAHLAIHLQAQSVKAQYEYDQGKYRLGMIKRNAKHHIANKSDDNQDTEKGA